MLRSFSLLLMLLFAFAVHAQQSATLTGLVTDPTGALIPGATVTLRSSSQPAVTDKSGEAGTYRLSAPAGMYVLDVSAPGFAPYVKTAVALAAGKPRTLDVQLTIATETQQVEVSSETGSPTDAANAGDSLTLSGSAIANLPTDQTQLNQQLTALTGGDAPEIYVDGFSNGTIPPKESIRAIKINQSPYSAQNDTNPVNGRLEILTKPGSDHFHGHASLFGNTSALDSKNPFAPNQPAYYTDYGEGNLSGPVSKTSSFDLYYNRMSYQGNAVISAQVLDANNQQLLLNQAVGAPNTDMQFSARYDVAFGKSSTATARYSFDQNVLNNAGTGQLTLESAGYNSTTTVQTLQLSNSQILSPHFVNDTRFQYVRSRIVQSPNSLAPALIVQGAFNGGGSNGGSFSDNLDRYELQNYVSAAEGKHFLNFGGRLRVSRDANTSRANYNGQYSFASLTAYQTTQQGLAAGLTPAQIRAAGGGATQFTVTSGQPSAIVSVADLGLFLQDDWKVSPSLTLSPGLRFETQSGIADHADYGPRLGLAYNLFRGHDAKGNDRPGNYTVRAGAGYFFARFGYSYLLQAERQNGVSQQQFVVSNPDTYPTLPAGATLGTAVLPSRYQLSSSLHAETYLNTTLTLERRIGSHGTVSGTYLTNHGTHTLVTRNANAPLPGTYNSAVPGSGVRPYGTLQNIYEYDSGGVFRATRLQTNVNLHFRDSFYVYGFYQHRIENTDGENAGFAAHPYDLGQDYGPSGYVRNILSIGGGAPLLFGLRTFSYVNIRSAAPYNITLGTDLNGDSIFNDRPTFATDLTRPSVVYTRYGALDTAPAAGQTTIPFDLGRAPGSIQTNIGLSRDFQFGAEIKPALGTPAAKLVPGKKAPKPDRRYTLSMQIYVSNPINHPNYGNPVTYLANPDPTLYTANAPPAHTSPGFDRPTSLAFSSSTGPRQVQLGSFFRF